MAVWKYQPSPRSWPSCWTSEPFLGQWSTTKCCHRTSSARPLFQVKPTSCSQTSGDGWAESVHQLRFREEEKCFSPHPYQIWQWVQGEHEKPFKITPLLTCDYPKLRMFLFRKLSWWFLLYSPLNQWAGHFNLFCLFFSSYFLLVTSFNVQDMAMKFSELILLLLFHNKNTI